MQDERSRRTCLPGARLQGISHRQTIFLGLLLCAPFVALWSSAADAQICTSDWNARLISVEGNVESRRSGRTDSSPAKRDDVLCIGDAIRRVRPRCGAASRRNNHAPRSEHDGHVRAVAEPEAILARAASRRRAHHKPRSRGSRSPHSVRKCGHRGHRVRRRRRRPEGDCDRIRRTSRGQQCRGYDQRHERAKRFRIGGPDAGRPDRIASARCRAMDARITRRFSAPRCPSPTPHRAHSKPAIPSSMSDAPNAGSASAE